MKISPCKDQTSSPKVRPSPQSTRSMSMLDLQSMDGRPSSLENVIPPGLSSRAHGYSSPKRLFSVQVNVTRRKVDPFLSSTIGMAPNHQDSSSLLTPSECRNIFGRYAPRRRQTSRYEHLDLTKVELLLDNEATLTALVESMKRLDRSGENDSIISSDEETVDFTPSTLSAP
jgi:hypothetical protein